MRPSSRLQQTTSNPSLLKLINEYSVRNFLDYDRNQALAQQLGVTSLPAQLFLLPDGRRIGGMEGYADTRLCLAFAAPSRRRAWKPQTWISLPRNR